MGKKKAVFFDIDGTLWDFQNRIPASTVEAIAGLKKQGHLVCISTGRTKSFLYDPRLNELSFHGILSGCGTHIEYQGKELFRRILSTEEKELAIRVLTEQNMIILMEGIRYLYGKREDLDKDPYLAGIFRKYPDRFMDLQYYNQYHDGAKFSVLLNGNSPTEAIDRLQEQYHIMVHNDHVMEIVPKGFSKASGIRYLCQQLNIQMEDTVAFGDSANDIDMLDAVGIGVAMGNASDITKEHADYITSDLNDDGIYRACVHLGLL